jgi:hypothetical protein
MNMRKISKKQFARNISGLINPFLNDKFIVERMWVDLPTNSVYLSVRCGFERKVSPVLMKSMIIGGNISNILFKVDEFGLCNSFEVRNECVT